MIGSGIDIRDSFRNDPVRWIPEYVIAIGVTINTIAGLIVTRFITRAVWYYRFRMASGILMIVILFNIGLRLSFAGLDQGGKYWILAGCMVSLLALSTVPGQTRVKMVNAREHGWLRSNLDEKHWTWHASTVHRERLDSPIKMKEKENLLNKINKLHWLAPALGIYLARNFAQDKVTVFFVFVSIVISLMGIQVVLSDLGIVQQLLIWEKDTGKPLLLREVWQKTVIKAEER